VVTMTALERFRDALTAHGCNPRGTSARCPAHDDRSASLSFSPAKQFAGVVVKCHAAHANCSVDGIVAVLGLTRADLFDDPRQAKQGEAVTAEYLYRDETGTARHGKWRYWPKRFIQWRPTPDGGKVFKLDGVERVLFHLPELLAEKNRGEKQVYLVEGEEDVLALERAGLVATTWTEGAWQPGQKSKWRPEYTQTLTGWHVTIVQDRDDAGRNTATDIAAELQGRAAKVRIVEAKDGKDARDHLEVHGHSVDEFMSVDTPQRRIRLTRASTIKPRPVRWAWADRIPIGELTLTPGHGGIGKSTFHVWCIAHLTRGTLPGVHCSTPKPCIIAASEDSWERTIVPRLMAAGADMDLVYRVDVITETDEVVSISLPRDVDALTVEITHIGVALLSVDPVMSVLSSGLDSHKDREVRLGLEPLARLADQTGCAVLGNAHFNKSTGSDPMALIMGSAAFANVSRAALGFARDPDDEDSACVISQVKNNLGRLDLPSLRYRIDSVTIDTDEGPTEVGKLVMLGETDRSVADILRDRGKNSEEARSDLDEAADWIAMFLTEVVGTGYAPAAEVIRAGEAAGFHKHTLQRARKRRGIRTSKADFGGGWVWAIREDDRQGNQDYVSQETASSSPPPSPSGETVPEPDYSTLIETVESLLPGREAETLCPVCDQPLALPNQSCSASRHHGGNQDA
jgi:5S rRNA maturation endonuclease (ribonuclease M5)